jgi:Fur family ferric uptake transcriptional regulator
LTSQRETIVEVLLDKKEDHLSVDEVYHYAKLRNKEIGLATVYRTLEILTELDVVNRITFADDGVVLYDLRANEKSHFHSHLFCQVCGKVIEIEEDLLTDLESEVAHRFGFEVRDHHLTFEGVCQECKTKETKSE